MHDTKRSAITRGCLAARRPSPHILFAVLLARLLGPAYGQTWHDTILFEWYAQDFRRDGGSVLEFVSRYSPELRQDSAEGG